MNKKAEKNSKSSGSASSAGSKKPTTQTSVKIPRAEKQKMRDQAKSMNSLVSILCTNGKILTTRSSVASKNQPTQIEIYSDPFMHVAWNPSKARNIMSKNSGFSKRFGDLSTI